MRHYYYFTSQQFLESTQLFQHAEEIKAFPVNTQALRSCANKLTQKLESHWFSQITLLKHSWQQSLVILVTPWFFFNHFSFCFSTFYTLQHPESVNCNSKSVLNHNGDVYQSLNNNVCTPGWHYLDVIWVTIFCSISEANRDHAFISFLSDSVEKKSSFLTAIISKPNRPLPAVFVHGSFSWKTKSASSSWLGY